MSKLTKMPSRFIEQDRGDFDGWMELIAFGTWEPDQGRNKGQVFTYLDILETNCLPRRDGRQRDPSEILRD